MDNTIQKRTIELIEVLKNFDGQYSHQILDSANCIFEAFTNGRKLLICGNGGSAADSQHLAAEFVNAFSRSIERKALPALALTTDASVITSISNDFSFENIFSRQVEALGNKGDVLLAISTSGTSINCIKALKAASQIGMQTIAMTRTDAPITEYSDLSITAPSFNTQVIQACHLHAYHLLTEIIENRMFGER